MLFYLSFIMHKYIIYRKHIIEYIYINENEKVIISVKIAITLKVTYNCLLKLNYYILSLHLFYFTSLKTFVYFHFKTRYMFYTHYLYIYIFHISGKARFSLTDDKYKVFQQIKNLYQFSILILVKWNHKIYYVSV